MWNSNSNTKRTVKVYIVLCGIGLFSSAPTKFYSMHWFAFHFHVLSRNVNGDISRQQQWKGQKKKCFKWLIKNKLQNIFGMKSGTKHNWPKSTKFSHSVNVCFTIIIPARIETHNRKQIMWAQSRGLPIFIALIALAIKVNPVSCLNASFSRHGANIHKKIFNFDIKSCV